MREILLAFAPVIGYLITHFSYSECKGKERLFSFFRSLTLVLMCLILLKLDWFIFLAFVPILIPKKIEEPVNQFLQGLFLLTGLEFLAVTKIFEGSVLKLKKKFPWEYLFFLSFIILYFFDVGNYATALLLGLNFKIIWRQRKWMKQWISWLRFW